MNFLRPSSRLLRCAVELRMAVDFMTIGLVYIFNQWAILYGPVL
jgi:hypothetical protein